MYESNNIITFHGLINSSSYHTFLLDEERSRLFVGAKDHIFSFNLVNIKEYQKVLFKFDLAILQSFPTWCPPGVVEHDSLLAGVELYSKTSGGADFFCKQPIN